MNAAPTPTRKYDLSFARYVYQNIDGGDRMAKCMQCGTCSGSCPLGDQMDYGPRKLFMMIRAGMKEAVLTSNTIWNCVSCYNCVVRCPRKVPVTYILHDLATLAVKEGYEQAKTAINARFAKAFWWSAARWGRTDERLVTAIYYFSFGLSQGMKMSLANLKIAQAMVKTKRMHLGMPHKIKNGGDLKAILAKAAEIQARDH
ncbi:MAG: 4Fe-4S dicluster domain-containing protein [Alphaproteobacteria bacterium]|nr:4Fe-4S dicluster domain-containing protein [Alphaproteobacteria bacterium]MBF0391038.1 4Fe-4S dicluster domain-containing protein [Alphaproteobacteria bacterium]